MVLESIPKSIVTVTATLGNIERGRTLPKDGKLVFTPQNWNRPQKFNILPIDNDVDDGDAEYNVSFSIRSADKSFDKQELKPMVVLTEDNDVAAVVASTASNRDGHPESSISSRSEPGRRLNVYTSENGTVAFIDIVLNSEPSANVEIMFYADGNQYSGKTSSKKGKEEFVEVSSLTCESHAYSSIDNVEACAKAAKVNDKTSITVETVLVQNVMDKPSGCYSDAIGNQIFMNRAATGVKVGDGKGWKLLCRSFSLVFTNSQGQSPWHKTQTIQIVPEEDSRVTTQQWVLAREVNSQDSQYNDLAMSSIFVQYDDNDMGIANKQVAVFSKVTGGLEQFWSSSTGAIVIVVIVCLGLFVAALLIIFMVQRRNYRQRIKDERQKVYQYRQRILSESSEHSKSIVFHRS